MGEMILLVCSTCDIVRSEDIGVGMLGRGHELCACYTCKRYVRKKLDFRENVENDRLICPYCRRGIRPLKDRDLCPKCNDEIKIEWIGTWD